jgi:hypothetical protein
MHLTARARMGWLLARWFAQEAPRQYLWCLSQRDLWCVSQRGGLAGPSIARRVTAARQCLVAPPLLSIAGWISREV